MASARVLVTGATGMVGRHLVLTLLKEGVRVRALVRPNSDDCYLQRLPVDIVVAESGRGEAILQWVEGTNGIFHLASHLTVGSPFGAYDASPNYQSVNVELTDKLLHAAKKAGVTRFVYTSSSSVYGISAAAPVNEDAPLVPMSPYAASKVEAERLVRSYESHGLETTIVRPPVIYGPWDRYFTPTALGLSRLPVLPLVNAGRNLFDLVYAQDVAELLVIAAQSEVAANRTYNAGPGRPTSTADLVAAFRKITARGPRIVSVSPRFLKATHRFFRPIIARMAPGAEAALSGEGLALMGRDMHLDMSRAREELGYWPRYSLEEGLQLTLAEFTLTKGLPG